MDKDTKPEENPLRVMYERVKALDPLSGPNVLRYAARIFRDNGDGTMTLRRDLPECMKNNTPTEKT